MQRWLDPSVLSWSAFTETSGIHDDKSWKRPYEIWEHAMATLKATPSEFQRTDALIALRRAVDRRVRQLQGIYDPKMIPIATKPSGVLELFTFFGVVRPQMLERLIEIRNRVEHEDAAPPSLDDLQVYQELVWYFLRSTDFLVRQSVESFMLNRDEERFSSYWLEVTFGPEVDWIPKFRGWVEPNHWSPNHRPDWIHVQNASEEPKKELLARTPSPENVGLPGEFNSRGENPGDLYIQGEIRGPDAALRQLTALYFELM